MAKQKWTTPSAATIAYFEHIAPGPPIEARQMFGVPSRFLNGHMLVSVFGDVLMLHLSEKDRAACIAAGARPFAPFGRSAKEYVEVTRDTFKDQELKQWIARGMRYLGSLPPRLETAAQAKATKAKAKATKAKAKATKAKAKAKAKPVPKRAAPKRAAPKRAAPKRAAPKRAAPKRAVKGRVAAKRGGSKRAPKKRGVPAKKR